MPRMLKSNWLDLGLEILIEKGSSAIRIDLLCEAAGRTKGSFYHHFNDRDEFVTDLIAYWEIGLTDRVQAQAKEESAPKRRLEALNQLAGHSDAALERALRRWSGSEHIVEAGIARVDRRRVEYLASLWHQMKNISSQQAIDLAVMNYASLIGFQQFYTTVGEERRERIDALYAQISDRLPDRN